MSQEYRWLKNAAKKLPYSLEDSRVNRIALQGNVLHLVMSVICGENLRGSFEKLSQDGLWLKTYQGFCQVSMEGFSDEFCGTWPTWGTMRDGECFRHFRPVWSMNAKEFSLLPTPTASDGMAWMTVGKNCLKTVRYIFAKKGNPSKHLIYLNMLCENSAEQAANFYEEMMGFPLRWTDLNA